MKMDQCLSQWWIRQADDSFQPGQEVVPSQEAGWIYSEKAEQVQKILLDQGKIDARVAVGETEKCRWIEETDWIYFCRFYCPHPDGIYELIFPGVDLFADFYLNGERIGSHDDMLIPARLNVTGRLHEENSLLVYFHSTRRLMRELYEAAPEEKRRYINPHGFLRKGQIEFGDAGKVSMINTGLFEDVILRKVDRAQIEWPDIDVKFDYWYRFADICCTLHGSGAARGLSARMRVFSPEGELAGQADIQIPDSPEWSAPLQIRVEQPQLWWPKNYGPHPLYTVTFDLFIDGESVDSARREVGLRHVEKTGDMRFRVNGREIKQWGALLEPFTGLTHRWDPEKCREMIELTDRGNMNTLRIWGGSMQFGDTLYEECDRRGILVWQEFCVSWNPTPDTEEMRKKYRAEAEHEVRRVKHHACVLLYSGGNESYVGMVEGIPEKLEYGWKSFREDFKGVCRRLDPERFYLESSPCGGDYPSDPREGDSHPLYYTYRHAVVQYPLFISEQARSTTGPLRSLRRFMADEELWPEGYVNQVTAGQYNPTYNISYPDKPYYQYDPDYQEKYQVGWSVPQLKEDTPFMVTSWKKVPIPETWWRRAASFFASECGPLERFFDAENIEELVYRINAATAWFFKDDAERIRRGKPHYEAGEPRRCQGYIYVKLNDTWPQFYCTLIDFFQEVYIPYYQYRRSLNPVLLSFDFQDRIFLWGVNDTSEEVQGTLRVRVFSQIRNRIANEFSIPVSIEAGESKVLTTLDRVCPIVTESVVHAVLTGPDGDVLSSSDTLMDMERHQTFPQAELSLRTEGNTLIIHTDRYAHCVEITGSEDGDEFGWYFTDNYFNLFPYEEKRVEILGHHSKGVIRAKAHYSNYVTETEYTASRC